jgi:hypothetical protein
MVGHPAGNLNPEGSNVYKAKSGALEDTKLATSQFPRFLESRYHKPGEDTGIYVQCKELYTTYCVRECGDRPYVGCPIVICLCLKGLLMAIQPKITLQQAIAPRGYDSRSELLNLLGEFA